MSRTRETALRDEGVYRLMSAVIAGFLATLAATIVLVLAYSIAVVVGSSNAQAPTIIQWIGALANNVVTRDIQRNLPLAILVHFLAGIGWAVPYATLIEPRLNGPGWRRGIIFSLLPWALSLLVFLPAVGGGFLGLSLGAGPLPVLGNLILHLVYGATLGQIYAAWLEHPVSSYGEGEEAREAAMLPQANRAVALGIVVGCLFGALFGLLFGMVFLPGLGPYLPLLIGAFLGSAFGMLVGSFLGLEPQ